MKIKTITIHNIRSVIDATLRLNDYSLIIGENNSGKTTLINAIRLFYEHDGYKYKKDRDFPKIETTDQDSYVEICYETNQNEQDSLKDEYKQADNCLSIRKYFESSDKKLKGNYYGYENGSLTHANQFYGASQVGQGKLGKILYIPALSKTDDGLKMTGPSPLRSMVNFVFEKIVENNPAYKNLTTAFETFNDEVVKEQKDEDISIDGLTNDINNEIEQFDLGFGLRINQIRTADIIKNLVSHFFEDKNLDGNIDDVNALGQGVQRHIIYTLIKLSAKYTKPKRETKKDFNPNLTCVLFEEPEAFLHPSQQEQLNISLRDLSNSEDTQVLLTTHSATFVSRNIEDITDLMKVRKINGKCNVFQLDDSKLAAITSENIGMYQHFCDCLNDVNIAQDIKNQIKKRKLGDEAPNYDDKLEEESLKYFLWMNGERSSLFFARHVIICEGASEKIYMDYLMDNEWKDLRKKHLYILDALGKYNLHRFMNLFKELGIPHSVIYDKDNDRDVHLLINNFIEGAKNSMTKSTFSFAIDFEDYLDIPKSRRDDLYPSRSGLGITI